MNLTEKQIALAKSLLSKIESQQLDESFHAVWGTGLSSVKQPILINGDGNWFSEESTFGDFNALAQDGFLRMSVDGGHAFPKGVKGYTPTNRHFSCTITAKMHQSFRKPSNIKPHSAMSTVDVFISHSKEDSDIAEGLIELIQAAANIKPARIRCTSVDGYRLPGGAHIDGQIKLELNTSACFLALLTPASLRKR